MLFHLLQSGLDSVATSVAEAIANTAEPVAQAAPQQVEQSFSLIEMAAKGGWLMIVLAVLSVIAIYIFGKKWWMIHKAQQVDKNFMRDIRDYIHEGKVKSALSLCEKYDSPVARLVEKVLKGIKDVLNPQKQLLIVIAAGVPSQNIKEWLGEQCPPLFLIIPNIAIAELSSMTFIVPVGTTEAQTKTVVSIFDEMGDTLITDEQHLAAGTTLASCGIAYAMRYIRAASEGGVELGFKADDAKKIVMQTMKGAVDLLQASGMHPEQAIDLVTTPGGVTIKGLNEMEHAGFTSAVIRGLKAGVK